MRLSMADRDAYYMDHFLRWRGKSGPITYLLNWIGLVDEGKTNASNEHIYLCALMLSWMLVVTDSNYRDRVSAALCSLLCGHISIMKQVLMQFEAMDDVYILEQRRKLFMKIMRWVMHAGWELRTMACFDTTEIFDEDRGLFFHKKLLEQFLSEHHYRMFWQLLGEKRIIGGSYHDFEELSPGIYVHFAQELILCITGSLHLWSLSLWSGGEKLCKYEPSCKVNQFYLLWLEFVFQKICNNIF